VSSFLSRSPASEPQPVGAALIYKDGEANQFLAAIIESSEDAIIGESLDGTITSWNRGAEKMFGYRREDAMGKSVSILHTEGDAEELGAILELIQQGRSATHFETKRKRKDGTHIDVSISVSPVRDESYRVIGAAKIIRDITDRKRTEELNRRAEKLAVTGRLAASVAHEINNPLAALTNLLYLLKAEKLSEQASEFLSMADRELGRIAHITTQALGFYKESGPASPYQLHQLVDQALAIHQHRIEAGSIEVEEQCEESISVLCHGGEIKQVLVNLIGNALDAMNGDGRLRIRVRAVSDSKETRSAIHLSIGDNGPGIPKEMLKHLFEPFNTTKGQTRTGLGLWMCEQIVVRHRGQIKIKSSQHPTWHGTVVRIVLPAG
jgi:PAS domain S-box-containing protein